MIADVAPLIALETHLVALRSASGALRNLQAQGVTHDNLDTLHKAHMSMALSNCETAVELLPTATPYFWTRDTMQLVRTVSETYPLREAVLNADRFRDQSMWYWCDDGFGMINAPNVQRGPHVGAVAICGIAAGLNFTWKPALRIVGFTRYEDRPGWLNPVIELSWMLGEKYSYSPDADEKWLGQHGASDQSVEADWLPKFVLTAQQWLSQRILTTAAAPLRRSDQRRATKALDHVPALNIVQLRARESSSADSDSSSSVEWSCRWLVSGHWRNQYHASTGEHVPTWIEPYLKGPEDKPLKVNGPKVFAVTR